MNIKKILKLIIYNLLFFSFLITANANFTCAETVSGKVIWVSPFFGFIYIRLANKEIPVTGSNLDIYLKTNAKSGKISSITSYHDVIICMVEPPELVREIRKGDQIEGDIKLAKPKKTKSLINDDIIHEFEQKRRLVAEIKESESATSLPAGSEKQKEFIQAELEEKKKKIDIEEQTRLLKEAAQKKEFEEKRKEEDDKNKVLVSMTPDQWVQKGETAADPNFKIEYFKNAIKLKHDHVNAHYKLGKVYHENGKLDEAITEYDEAQKYDKNNALIYNNMADIYQRLGLLDMALKSAQKAVTISPNLTVAWVTLGEIYEVKLDNLKAIDAFSHAIDDPKWKTYVTDKIEKLQK